MVHAIIDPTASARKAGASNSDRTATALTSLKGLRVGLLENTKRNAAALLGVIGASLQRSDGVGDLVPVTKVNFSLPLPDDLLDRLSAECDLVVIGVGDCGSCSASAVADGIMLESRGIPTAVICTDAFAVPASAMASVKGRPDFPYLRTAHPIANLVGDEVDLRGAQLAAAVRTHLLAGEESAA
ncbi:MULTISPECIES: UGSC family (seleno)protein [unclassified Microbacterium]|uniref:UGSC family (seleno)protein n=1 Tax=unclassified Microbacterium TaxID=2609290 RepID=UPI00214CB82B|nr:MULTISPECIES: UGSC family (seleno)protein [unclassified Microbacterium]MCR2808397.1 UGSC family (seleno)protein [Microbacterium sp. zg.B185]WIM19157.1 UGSC family (seleno)protein [Microbacterium sp. zg-B185]